MAESAATIFCPLLSYAAEFLASWYSIVQPWQLFLKDRALHGVPGPDLAGLVAKRESTSHTSKIGRKMRENSRIFSRIRSKRIGRREKYFG